VVTTQEVVVAGIGAGAALASAFVDHALMGGEARSDSVETAA